MSHARVEWCDRLVCELSPCVRIIACLRIIALFANYRLVCELSRVYVFRALHRVSQIIMLHRIISLSLSLRIVSSLSLSASYHLSLSLSASYHRSLTSYHLPCSFRRPSSKFSALANFSRVGRDIDEIPLCSRVLLVLLFSVCLPPSNLDANQQRSLTIIS